MKYTIQRRSPPENTNNIYKQYVSEKILQMKMEYNVGES